jgi:hypothetical protein
MQRCGFQHSEAFVNPRPLPWCLTSVRRYKLCSTLGGPRFTLRDKLLGRGVGAGAGSGGSSCSGRGCPGPGDYEVHDSTIGLAGRMAAAAAGANVSKWTSR